MKKAMKAVLSLLVAVVTVFTCIPMTAFAADEAELIGDVQATVPDLKITIDSGYSLDTIHASKDEKIRAHVSVNGAWDSSFNMASTGVEMKTRGNSTFGYMKKPYQIKFDSKTDMFGMGKAEKWVLLANYVDGSFIRNKIVFDIAEKIGMPYVCKSVFVNLYINGDYKGVYQLCEKVEIGDNRVPLEHAWGVIAEMESAKRVAEEEFYFRTSVTGKPFVYKEYNTDFEETADAAIIAETAKVKAFFEERINTLENELYNNGKNWALVESLIDVDSFIQFYFINELCMNVDATLASTYFYIDGPDDVLHMGPLWDYDRSFGSYDYSDSGYEQGAEADFLKNIIDCSDEYRVEWFKMLFQYPEFVERVNEMYTESIADAFDTDRINATIDAYQDVLYDSLMRNYVDEGWALFHSISEAEFFSNEADAAEYLEYTVNYIKNNIKNRVAYLDKAYGQYHPALFYKQNAGRTYSGGSMTDSENMNSFSMYLDGDIDGSVSYTATGARLSVSTARDGEAISGTTVTTLKMSLEGNVSNYYSIQYRVYSNGAWSSWKADGAQAGSTSSVISRVQTRLVEKAPVKLSTVVFDVDSVAPVSTVAGNVVTLPALPEGYEGWYLTSDFSGDAVTELTAAEGEVCVYAKEAEKEEVELVKGDLDGDGSVSATDINLTKRIVSGVLAANDRQLDTADVNNDGVINGFDSNLITRIAAGIQ